MGLNYPLDAWVVILSKQTLKETLIMLNYENRAILFLDLENM